MRVAFRAHHLSTFAEKDTRSLYPVMASIPTEELETSFVMIKILASDGWNYNEPQRPARERSGWALDAEPEPKESGKDVEASAWTSVSRRHVIAAASYWDSRVLKRPCRWMAQAERREGRFVLKLMLETKGVSLVTRICRHLAHIRSCLVSDVYEGRWPSSPEWFSVARDRPSPGCVRIFTLRELIQILFKVQGSSLLGAWTNIRALGDIKTLSARRGLLERATSSVHTTEESRGAPKAALRSFSRLVRRLIELGIADELSWAGRDPEGFLEYMCTAHRRQKARRAIYVAKYCMLACKSAADYLVTSSLRPTTITENLIFSTLSRHGFSPREVGTAFVSCTGGTNDRNALWLIGPPGSLGECLTAAIATSVPLSCFLSGTVSPRCLEACADKMLIWWRSAGCDARAKSLILRLICGEPFTVPTRTGSLTVRRTPVIITSESEDLPGLNQDDIERISSCSVKIKFRSWTGTDVTIAEMSEFLGWADTTGSFIKERSSTPLAQSGSDSTDSESTATDETGGDEDHPRDSTKPSEKDD